MLFRSRTARFMASRVLALVEHPAPRAALPDDLPTQRPAPRPVEPTLFDSHRAAAS